MKKLNIIDVIIVVVIIAGIAAVGLLKTGGDVAEDSTKRVTVELSEKREGFSENVVIGDSVIEKVKKERIGKVVGVEVKPCIKNSYDRLTGAAKLVTIPEREDVYVTIEVSAAADVAIGKHLSIITKHFTGAGYITEMEEVQ